MARGRGVFANSITRVSPRNETIQPFDPLYRRRSDEGFADIDHARDDTLAFVQQNRASNVWLRSYKMTVPNN